MTASHARAHTNYHAGLSAEDCVARLYADKGMHIAHRRWCGSGGEIDLIVRNGDEVIFVEVKKSRSHHRAALRLSPRQMARILASGEEFLGREPKGLLTEARFDVALVDATGRAEIIENALMAA